MATTIPFTKKRIQFSTRLAIINLVMWFILLITLFGCEPAIEPTRQFVTYKGDHYSWPKLTEALQSNKLVFEAKFNETAKYDLGDPALQSDKNKLMGFTDCNSLVHENSARFAWQWFNNQLEIYAYCYVNGNRQEKLVGVVNINQYNHYELELASDHYIFRLNNLPPISMKRGATCNTGIYFKLWPYFGGHIAAPHDVIIDIKTIY